MSTVLTQHRTEPQTIEKASSKFCVCNSSEDSVFSYIFQQYKWNGTHPRKALWYWHWFMFWCQFGFCANNIRQFCIRVIHWVAFLTFKLLTKNQFAWENIRSDERADNGAHPHMPPWWIFRFFNLDIWFWEFFFVGIGLNAITDAKEEGCKTPGEHHNRTTLNADNQGYKWCMSKVHRKRCRCRFCHFNENEERKKKPLWDTEAEQIWDETPTACWDQQNAIYWNLYLPFGTSELFPFESNF